MEGKDSLHRTLVRNELEAIARHRLDHFFKQRQYWIHKPGLIKRSEAARQQLAQQYALVLAGALRDPERGLGATGATSADTYTVRGCAAGWEAHRLPE